MSKSKLSLNWRKALALVTLFFFGLAIPPLPAALAAPYGGQVASGQATISQSSSTTTIDQGSNKVIINWQGFSIAPSETVNFKQPSVSSVALNRVKGHERSLIDGALNANGKVFLVNSNGILFGKGASVNTAALVASTLNIKDKDFNEGDYSFSGDGGQIVNKGQIKTADGGYVALLGGDVHNEGVIVATRGTVSLNGANKATLNFNEDTLVSVSLDEGALNALVESKNAIFADGGSIILTAKAVDSLVASQVNVEGLLQSRALNDLRGKIVVYAHGGQARIDGKLDASAPNGGDGGFIETSGDQVKIADSAVVTTKAAYGKSGSWLIDPNDYTIAVGGDMSGAAVGQALDSNGDLTISSTQGKNSEGNGNIYVNDAISWSANSILTLDAENDIYINNAIKATGESAGLVLKFLGDYHLLTKASYSGVEAVPYVPGVAGAGDSKPLVDNRAIKTYGSVTLSGSNASFTVNDDFYNLIHSMADFASVNNAGTANYALAKNIDNGDTIYPTAVVTQPFSGVLAGLGNTITNLKISGTTYLGLFKETTGGEIRDLGLLNVDIDGTSYIGALVSNKNGSTTIISHVYATGEITGFSNLGGLVGQSLLGGDIKYCYTDINITGSTVIGGLVGTATDTNFISTHSSGNVTGGGNKMGGLVGVLNGTLEVDKSYFSGELSLSSPDYGMMTLGIGGLIGTISQTNIVIRNSFATCDVGAPENPAPGSAAGGLVGNADTSGLAVRLRIENSYATGNIYTYLNDLVGISGAGGLVGKGRNTDIYYSHATGNVLLVDGSTSYPYSGGLIGLLNAHYASSTKFYINKIENCYATGDVRSQMMAGGLVGQATLTAINNSFATGNVVGIGKVGGLIGQASSAQISDGHAYGNVTGSTDLGGLVGEITTLRAAFVSLISGSSASGDINIEYITSLGTSSSVDYEQIGGLYGYAYKTNLENNLATGSFIGAEKATRPETVGGLGHYAIEASNPNGYTNIGNSYHDVKAEAKAAARAEAAETRAAANVETMVPAPTVTEVANKVVAQREEETQAVGEIASSVNTQKNTPVNVVSTGTITLANLNLDTSSLDSALGGSSLGGSFSSGSVVTSYGANIATVSSGEQSFFIGASSSGSSPTSSIPSAIDSSPASSVSSDFSVTASSPPGSSSRGSGSSKSSSSNAPASDSKKSSDGSSSGGTSSNVDDDEA
ncbi:MAG: filamentous hemagglutinin N-terminal domain-containing protein [Deltaproteobacteria bacterium]|jgi:filamentous hemagglutinin family protein|nr:filamentous hemagglutinin N-terminal domain-containing protein [Deltaproteobacteria bacterium]